MVDVSDKDNTTRIATASGIIEVTREAYDAVVANTAKKGPVLQTAVIAAIQGTKQHGKTHRTNRRRDGSTYRRQCWTADHL